MKRKYLEEIGVDLLDTPWGWNNDDTERKKEWSTEKEIKGFDTREIWSLDYTMDLLLYERLCNYKEVASEFLDLKFKKFKFKNEELTLEECLDRMINGLKYHITLDEMDEKRDDIEVKTAIAEIYEIYSVCNRSLWL